jgi:hypothetical protein
VGPSSFGCPSTPISRGSRRPIRKTSSVDLAIKEIDAEIAARQAAQAVIIAEQGRWYTAIVRPLIVLPFAVYIWKVAIWDIVPGIGSTDAIRGDVASLMVIVVGSHFGGRTIEKVAQIAVSLSCRRSRRILS